MTDGFIKVAVGTPEVRVADCAFNMGQVVKLAQQAAQQRVKLLVTPELCLTGCTCGDLFLHPTLQKGALEALEILRKETASLDLVLVVGLPVAGENRVYNCAAVLCHGKLLGLVPKTSLSQEEKRWFAPMPEEGILVDVGGERVVLEKGLFRCEELPEFFFGVEIGQDLWAIDPPSRFYVQAGATIIANPSASYEQVGQREFRRNLAVGQSKALTCGYLQANPGEGESTTDFVFGAHNLIAENGKLLAESHFQNGLLVSEVDVSKLLFERRRAGRIGQQTEETFWCWFSMPVEPTELTRPVSKFPFLPEDGDKDRLEEILTIQTLGLKKRIAHSLASTAVVGISGGLDSALALLVAVRAMDALGRPRTEVVAVTMPCFGTTSRTKGNAVTLCQQLGVTFRQVDIKESVDLHFQAIGHDPQKHDVTFENAQARERTQVLMDLANDLNGLVVGTGDLSELALGWATYNGDHMSMYGVNGGIPKTLVRRLVAYEAENTSNTALREALLDIVDTPVSPELLPPKEGEIQQKTEDLVGPYELHDFFLYYALRWAFPPRKVLRLARRAFRGSYGQEELVYWLRNFYRRFFQQQFKRSCLPDGPKVGSVGLSPRGDWRMPSDAVSNLWLEELESL